MEVSTKWMKKRTGGVVVTGSNPVVPTIIHFPSHQLSIVVGVVVALAVHHSAVRDKSCRPDQ